MLDYDILHCIGLIGLYTVQAYHRVKYTMLPVSAKQTLIPHVALLGLPLPPVMRNVKDTCKLSAIGL